MRYSENYEQTCQETEDYAARLLGRVLSDEERRAIWGAGTLTWLEIQVQVPLRLARAPEDVEVLLLTAAAACDARLADLIEGLAGLLGALLERPLTGVERQQLGRLPSALAVMQLGEALTEAATADRESTLRQRLAAL